MLLGLGGRAENQATLGHGRFEMSLCIMRRKIYVYGVKKRDLGNKFGGIEAVGMPELFWREELVRESKAIDNKSWVLPTFHGKLEEKKKNFTRTEKERKKNLINRGCFRKKGGSVAPNTPTR